MRSRWPALHARGKPTHAAVRATTLDNPRQTLGVLGYLPRRRGRLRAPARRRSAGPEAAMPSGRGATRIALIAQVPRAAAPRRGRTRCARRCSPTASQLPTARQGSERSPAARRASRSSVHRRSTRGACWPPAEATNLVRHLIALPPNLLDAGGYRRRARDARASPRTDAALVRRARAREARRRRIPRGQPRQCAPRRRHRAPELSRRARTRRGSGADVALVGKGILFDTGGTNLKPHRVHARHAHRHGRQRGGAGDARGSCETQGATAPSTRGSRSPRTRSVRPPTGRRK